MYELELNYPVSSNRYWRTFMPRGFKAPVTCLSAEAKAYKVHVKERCLLAGIIEPITGRVQVEYWLYPQSPQDAEKLKLNDPEFWDDGVRSIDLSNAEKVLFDALNGVAYVDDKLIYAIFAEKMEPDGIGRIQVRISKYER